MSLSELQVWLDTENGIKPELDKLRTWSASLSFGLDVIKTNETSAVHDWQKLLFAASIFAESEDRQFQEHALMVAQSAVCFSDDAMVRDAGSLVLSRLSNYRTISLAQSIQMIEPAIGQRVGMFEQLLWFKRRLNSEIIINATESFSGNRFQTSLWSKLASSDWLSATAPTAAGKTFTVLNWLLTQFTNNNCHSCVFIAPTRALVSEIERQLNVLKIKHGLGGLKVSSLPLRELSSRVDPFIAIFTQERLHIFLNSNEVPHQFDIAVIDEAQKLSDDRRGVILQDAIERVCRSNNDCRVVFLSPHSANPEVLLEEGPTDAVKSTVSSNCATVMQNLLVAEQVRGKPMEWTLSLALKKNLAALGTFTLPDRPTNITKKMAFIALSLGKESGGTLVYVNTAGMAEKIANIICDGLGDENLDDKDLQDLSESCSKIVHPKFQLVHLVKRGVAFHYGNMPSIIREEVERLFTNGKIKFLVSTSTLIEGVNLACKTIVIRGPRKGIGHVMSPQDFWNLAGRAGRWGADFYGNIVCVDVSKPDVWPRGLPEKTAYPIKRETDAVVQQFDDLANYLEVRTSMATEKLDPKLEHVAAYLMSWQFREGSLKNASPIKKIDEVTARKIEMLIQPSLEAIDIEPRIVEANPGISIVALQRLLDYFRCYSNELENLLPIPPEDSESVSRFVFIFDVINLNLAPVFGPDKRVLPCALTTWDWMRGKSLSQMIHARLKRESDKDTYQSDKELPYAKLIRETMASVEEIARFCAPKYLGAYLSVLKQFFTERECTHLLPEDLTYDLFLEFGVSTKTLISLIGLGLSRTSSLELGEFYGRSDMTEEDVLTSLSTGDWESLDLAPLVKREIGNIVSLKMKEATFSQ